MIKNAYKILVQKPKGTEYFGDFSVDGGTNPQETGCSDEDCVLVAQNRMQWQAVVNKVLECWSHKRCGISSLPVRLLAS